MWDLAFILHPCVQINICSTIVFMCSRCARTQHHIHFLWYSWQKKYFQVKLHEIVSTSNQNNIILILFCVNTYQANYVKTTYKDNDIVYGCRWCRYQCAAEFNGECMFSKHLNLALFRWGQTVSVRLWDYSDKTEARSFIYPIILRARTSTCANSESSTCANDEKHSSLCTHMSIRSHVFEVL